MEKNEEIEFDGKITRLRVDGSWRKIEQTLNAMRYRWEVSRKGSDFMMSGFSLTRAGAIKKMRRAARELVLREWEPVETFRIKESEL